MPEVYYPALAVNLVLRFDEALLTGNTPKPRNPGDLAAAAGLPSGPATLNAGLLVGASGRLSKRVGTVPRQCTVERAGYRQAGKFSMNFAFRDLPIDPRAIRALGVEVYIGTVTGKDFARSMTTERDYGRLAGLLSSNPANLRMVGVADTISTTYSDTGSEVVVEGRDLRGIFLDARIDVKVLKALHAEEDIGALVRQLLSYVPLADKIPVEVAPAKDWPGGIIPKVADKSVLTRVNKGAGGEDAKSLVKGSAETLVFWDLVTQLCFFVGAIPYFEGHTLWIRPVQSLYDRQNAPSPFKDGRPRRVQTSAGPEEFNYRRMVYGRNLQSLTFERKVGGTTKVPTIRCVANATDSSEKGASKRILEARWPEEGEEEARTTDVSPVGDSAKEEVLTIPIAGIKDKDRLTAIARALHEEIGRQEMGGSASSMELASLGGNNEDADILRLIPGDPVEFLTDATGLRGLPPVISELNNLAAMAPAEAVAAVAKRLGGDRDLAEVLVGTARGAFQKLQSTFRVETVRYGWDVLAGVSVDFDFKNYVEARYNFTVTEAITRVAQKAADSGAARQSVKVQPTVPAPATSKGGR